MTDFPKIGVIVVIVALMTSVAGSYLLNAEDVTSCKSDFSYITDVTGAFTDSDPSLGIEYNPQSNVTGYSVLSPSDTSSLVNRLGITYTTTPNANGYYVSESDGVPVNKSITLENIRDTSVSDTSPTSVGAKATWVEGGDTLNHVFGMGAYWGKRCIVESMVGANTFKQYGCASILVSEFINGYENTLDSHDVGSGVVSPNHLDTSSLVVLSFSGHQTNGYPFFAVDVSTNVVGNIAYVSYADSSDFVYVNPLTSKVSVNNTDYSSNRVWIIWGGDENFSYETKTATMDMNFVPSSTVSYIDPIYGVTPTDVTTSVTTYETVEEYASDIMFSHFFEPKMSGGVYESNAQCVTSDYIFYKNVPDPSAYAKYTIRIFDYNITTSNDWSHRDFVQYSYSVTLTVPSGLTYDIASGASVSYYVYGVPQSGGSYLYNVSEFIPQISVKWDADASGIAKVYYTTGAQPNAENTAIIRTLTETDAIISGHISLTSSDRVLRIRSVVSEPALNGYCRVGSVVSSESAGISIPFRERTEVGGTDYSHIPSYVTYIPHTETTHYTTTYWANGLKNEEISMLITDPYDYKSTAQRSFSVFFKSEKGDDEYKGMSISVYRADDSVWKVYTGVSGFIVPTSLGVWDGVLVKVAVIDGNVRISFYPVYDFNSFLDYNLYDIPLIMDIPVELVYPYDNFKCEYISHLRFSDTDSPYYTHEVVNTKVLMDAGKLYMVDAVFSEQAKFPNDTLVMFRVNSSAHVGDGMTVTTSGGDSIHLDTDGVSKFVYDGTEVLFGDVSIYYASSNMDNTVIDGDTFTGGLYLNGTFYPKGHLYIQIGKNAELMDIGATTQDWTITLDGTWAVATGYYSGENVAKIVTEWTGDKGEMMWDNNTVWLTFLGVAIAGAVFCAWKFELSLMDWVVIIFAGLLALTMLVV